MKLYKLLNKKHINLNMVSTNKKDALKELLSLITTDEKVGDVLLDTLMKREEMGSTGIGKGIAIPHGRSLMVNELVLAVGRSEEGIKYDAIDNKPVFFMFLIIAPPQDPGNQYLVTLGRVAIICQELLKNNQYKKPSNPDEFISLIQTIEEKL